MKLYPVVAKCILVVIFLQRKSEKKLYTIIRNIDTILFSLQLQTDAYYCIRGRVKNEFSFGVHQ